jgi:ABC-type Fe3+/spermidine/putrescine transport system ATPase subunit
LNLPATASESNAPGAVPATLLSIRNVAKQFGSTAVLRDISLDIATAEFLTILGESGSGKTTLLRLLAGFAQPDRGEIWMAGQRLDTLPPNQRTVNTVFQNYALFPHLSVFENVAYGLRAKRVPNAQVRPRVEQALAQVRMSSFEQRRPAQLSGGQQQRVALARALINRPRLLLLDEPLSALDANLRREMQTELKSLQREVGISFVFVTHDQDEAMALSDRIALLRAGELEQVDTPREIYNRPRTAYVAKFIGQTNLLRGHVENGIARYGPIEWPSEGPPGEAVFSLRPEAIRITDADSSAVRFRAKVSRQTFGGATDLLEVDCAGLSLMVRVPSQGEIGQEQIFGFLARNAVRVMESPR